MSFKELVKKNRSCRRFDNSYRIEIQTLRYLVDLARMSASAANRQPLKYIVCTDEDKNNEIFSCLRWAEHLKDWKGPVEKERPSAYIVIMVDHNITSQAWCDHGIAAQTILLGARDKNLGGCMFGAVNIKKIKDFFNIEDHLEVKLVVALGKPVERIRIDDLKEDGDIKYWRDKDQVHHVPKRGLDEIIINSF